MTRKEYKKEWDRNYKSSHRELLREKARKYREENVERTREISRRYYERNKERIKIAYTLGVSISSISREYNHG